jgi:hypothetical protein
MVNQVFFSIKAKKKSGKSHRIHFLKGIPWLRRTPMGKVTSNRHHAPQRRWIN